MTLRELEVRLELGGELFVGTLVENGGSVFFEYAPAFVASGHRHCGAPQRLW